MDFSFSVRDIIREWLGRPVVKPLDFIRIKGVRRVGSNFLMETLRANLIINVGTGGGAHKLISLPLDDNDEKYSSMLSIISIKNPYSWCISITKWATSAWRGEWENATWDRNWYLWEELYKKYNRFYRRALDFHNNYYNAPSMLLPYEDFLADPRKYVYTICNRCDTRFRSNKIVIPNKVPQSAKFSKERKKFFVKNGDFGLSGKMIYKINRCVDWELMSHFGYVRRGR